MKKTKIVCTIGPATADVEVLKKMILAGMNVARLNFSHGGYQDQERFIKAVKQAREEVNMPVALLLDTQGPEIRTGKLAEAPALLKAEEEFTLVNEDIIGDNTKVSVTYKDLYKDVKPGTTILIDDGKIEIEVDRIEGKNVVCKVMNGGELGNRKSINVPGTHINLPALKDKDIQDLKDGCKGDFDYIAASFIRSADDVLAIRKVLDENGGKDIKIISKIESQEGIDNFQSILEVSDGIMVARGDMGVEIPMEEVPIVQKRFIKECNRAGKMVITATQMLESMTTNPRATRAEVSDVANAVLDGTDAVMLSGETTVGKFPVEVVRYMAEICRDTEEYYDYDYKFASEREVDITETIADSVVEAASVLDIKLIIASTVSGDTARRISNLKPRCLILAATNSEKVARSLALNYAVYPTIVPASESTDEVVAIAKEKAKEVMGVKEGDIIAITGGFPKNGAKTTNLLKIEQL